VFLFRLAAKENIEITENFVTMKVQYDDLQGILQVDKTKLEFGATGTDYFQDSGIRKAILLVRYVDLFHNYLATRQDLTIDHRKKFKEFLAYFLADKQVIGDDTLKEELDAIELVLGMFSDEELVEGFFEPEPKAEEKNKGKEKETDTQLDMDATMLDTDKNKKRKHNNVDEDEDRDSKKIKPDEDEGLCVICLDAKKTVLVMPCKHLCMCKECTAKTTACPMCRVTIDSTTEVFL